MRKSLIITAMAAMALSVSAANGLGFCVSALNNYFDACALHYNISNLDEGDQKAQRHSSEVAKSKYTELSINLAHIGVGGENSWGVK